MRMLLQVSPQTCCISCIEKIDGPAKQGVLDSFMVRQFLGHWVFNSMPLHSSLTVTKKALGKAAEIAIVGGCQGWRHPGAGPILGRLVLMGGEGLTVLAVICSAGNDYHPMLETIGHYQIRRRIGQGAMGVVYEGWDNRLERPVAVKTIRSK